jgi:SET domain-containing protein
MSERAERPLLEVRRSPIHGTGVFAARPIAAGVELIEYRGRRITHAAADRRYAGSADSGHTFLFTLNERYIIDANVDGNDARWINHSCAPNCQAMAQENAGSDPRQDRVVIESLRAIAPGEELTYDYGIVLDQRHTARMKALWACRCGSPACTGTMLKPKRPPARSRTTAGS